jgi:hypothetical protein
MDLESISVIGLCSTTRKAADRTAYKVHRKAYVLETYYASTMACGLWTGYWLQSVE